MSFILKPYLCGALIITKHLRFFFVVHRFVDYFRTRFCHVVSFRLYLRRVLNVSDLRDWTERINGAITICLCLMNALTSKCVTAVRDGTGSKRWARPAVHLMTRPGQVNEGSENELPCREFQTTFTSLIYSGTNSGRQNILDIAYKVINCWQKGIFSCTSIGRRRKRYHSLQTV